MASILERQQAPQRPGQPGQMWSGRYPNLPDCCYSAAAPKQGKGPTLLNNLQTSSVISSDNCPLSTVSR